MGILDLLEKPSVRRMASFTGSLDYIDALPSKTPWVLKWGAIRRPTFYVWPMAYGLSAQRGPAETTNAKSKKRNWLSVAARETSNSDYRRFHPEGRNRPVPTTVRGAAQITHDQWDPNKEIEKQIRRARRPNPFSQQVQSKYELSAIKQRFNMPSRVVICLKRAIRREIMHALHLVGRPQTKIRRFTELSKIVC